LTYLLDSWKPRNIEDWDFSFFLNRKYNFRFSKSFTFEESIKVKAEIDTLLTKLNNK
jgi:hypothetical protein